MVGLILVSLPNETRRPVGGGPLGTPSSIVRLLVITLRLTFNASYGSDLLSTLKLPNSRIALHYVQPGGLSSRCGWRVTARCFVLASRCWDHEQTVDYGAVCSSLGRCKVDGQPQEVGRCG